MLKVTLELLFCSHLTGINMVCISNQVKIKVVFKELHIFKHFWAKMWIHLVS